jgi:hypothetical protein
MKKYLLVRMKKVISQALKKDFFFNINTIQIIYFLMFFTPSVKYLPPDLKKKKKLKSKKIPK